jgi:hypothetical protein
LDVEIYRVNKQRMVKKDLDDSKRSSMTHHKMQALEDVGFEWAKRKGIVSWETKYQELVEYHHEHGDCDVPTKYRNNPALGRWISTLRSEYKKMTQGEPSTMTLDRKERLEALGFKWNMAEREG